jgi:hypothetical protein
MIIWWRRLSLFCRIIGREHWADRRYGPVLAWQVACIIHPARKA